LRALEHSRVVYALLAVAAIFQMWPWYVWDIGGDALTYQLYTECFARTLAEGVMRPSWCRFADAGYGSTLFFFYFPLPYYIGSLLFPLKALGISTQGILTGQMLLANLLFAFTCFFWLRRHTDVPKALLVTLLVMYVPYRMELMFRRAAYAESFALALFPLWLIGVERVLEHKKRWHLLAVAVALAALSHTQTAVNFGIISGVYALAYTRRISALVPIAAASVVGLMIAAFFLLPAVHYMPFILGAGSGGTDYSIAVVNRYLQLDDISFSSRYILIIILTGMSLLAVTALVWRTKLKDRGMQAWALTCAVALALYSPLIAPVFDNSALVRSVFFPWRMQVVFIPVFAVLLLRYVTLPMSAKKQRTWKADLVILLLFLNLLQAFTVEHFEAGQDRQRHNMVKHMYMPIREYGSIWTPADIAVETITQGVPPEVQAGDATVSDISRRGDDWTLEVVAKTPSAIRLHQAYFPSWKAYDEADADVALTPDEATGKTILHAPAGNHNITLKNRIYAHAPWWVRLSPWISLLALGAIGAGLWRNRKRVSFH
jgi:hypothetical protein